MATVWTENRIIGKPFKHWCIQMPLTQPCMIYIYSLSTLRQYRSHHHDAHWLQHHCSRFGWVVARNALGIDTVIVYMILRLNLYMQLAFLKSQRTASTYVFTCNFTWDSVICHSLCQRMNLDVNCSVHDTCFRSIQNNNKTRGPAHRGVLRTCIWMSVVHVSNASLLKLLGQSRQDFAVLWHNIERFARCPLFIEWVLLNVLGVHGGASRARWNSKMSYSPPNPKFEDGTENSVDKCHSTK